MQGEARTGKGYFSYKGKICGGEYTQIEEKKRKVTSYLMANDFLDPAEDKVACSSDEFDTFRTMMTGSDENVENKKADYMNKRIL